MAYTTIDDPTIYFNTKLYTGNGSTNAITGVGFQPDWVWIKNRDSSGYDHLVFDSVRGVLKGLNPSLTEAESSGSDTLTNFNSDGFTLGANSSGNDVNLCNQNTKTYVAWNWKAGGTAPAITYNVKVVSDSGNKYRFDDFGTSAVTLDLQEGGTYTFDQSDSSNAGHPLRFYTASDKSGGEYTTGVTTTGTAGSSGAKTVITVAASAPTLYYQCSNHAGMGGQANTNSTFGSSNFSGSFQSTVSANTTAGFSIVSYTGTFANATVGHGLGVAPKVIILKNRDSSNNWCVGHGSLGFDKHLALNETDAVGTDSSARFRGISPTSTVYSVGVAGETNGNSQDMIAYCLAEKQGYSKFGKYTGNGNADGTFVYTGFRPAWVMIKRTDGTNSWVIYDNKREGFNVDNDALQANGNNAEGTSDDLDFLSNGFKMRTSGVGENGSGNSYIFIAFAESPFVNSNGVPTNAR